MAGVVLAVLALLSGCEKFKSKGDATQADTSTGLSGADAALTDKLQPFIECLNRTDKSLAEHTLSYRSHFQHLMGGPRIAGKWFSSFKIAVYETNNEFSRACAAGLRKAMALKPEDSALDRLGKDYADTLEALIPLMNEADLYYGQENHRDDQMAKGRELNGKLEPLLVRIGELSGELHAAVDDRQDKLAESQLKSIEDSEGRRFSWHTENVMLQASRALKKVDQALQGNDVQALVAAETSFQQAFDQAVAYGTAHPDTKTRLGNKPMWFSLQSYAQGYLQAIKTLRRDMAEGKADLRGDPVWTEYNSMVRDYNLRVRNGG